MSSEESTRKGSSTSASSTPAPALSSVELTPVPRVLQPQLANAMDGAESARFVALVRRGPATQVLEQLQAGTEHWIHPRVSLRLRARALLLDVDRVYGRVLVQIARLGPTYDTTQSLDAWLTARIDEAAASIKRQDEEDEASGIPFSAEETQHFGFLSDCFGIPPEQVRRSSVAFHNLCEWDRQALFAMLVEGRSMQELLDTGFGPRERLRERVVRSLKVLIHATDAEPGYDAPPGERDPRERPS